MALEDGGVQSRGEPSPALLLLLLPVLTIQKHASIKSRSASECARCPSTGATQHAIAYERSAATATSPAAHGVQKVAYRHRPAPPAHMSMGPLAHWNCGDITIMTCVGGRGRGAPRMGERERRGDAARGGLERCGAHLLHRHHHHAALLNHHRLARPAREAMGRGAGRG